MKVLRPSPFPQDRTRDLRDDVPLETVANRSVPMGCGPNVDQAWLGGRGAGPVRVRTPSVARLLGSTAALIVYRMPSPSGS